MENRERVVFGHTMSAMLDRCGKRLSSEHWEALARLGVEKDKRLPAYEFERWCQVIDYLARTLYPELPQSDAEYQLGRDFIEVYAETMVGRALFTFLKLLGMHRTIPRLARSFRTGTNFTEVEARDEQASQCTLWFSVVEPRGRITQGILCRGLELVGGPSVKVALLHLEGESATYQVSWQD